MIKCCGIGQFNSRPTGGSVYTQRIQGLVLLLLALAASAVGQTFTTLVVLEVANGANPGAPMQLVQGLDGNLWGTTFGGGTLGSGTIFKITEAGDLTTVVNFPTEGIYNPDAGLSLSPTGSFYGTTQNGGANGFGYAFAYSPNGNLTVFDPNFNGDNGFTPLGGLVRSFNGITSNGGSYGLVGNTR
jgi:uncharacterized repeat protein (TIGR03803 family)